MADLHAIARECTEIACANGFDKPTWANLPIKVMLAVTELQEAYESIDGGGADPLDEELADYTIRVLSILDAVWGDSWHDRTRSNPWRYESTFQPIEVLLWPLLTPCCAAVEKWRGDARDDARTCLEIALLRAFQLARTIKIDLHHAIAQKMAKNRGRTQLHGQVRSEG